MCFALLGARETPGPGISLARRARSHGGFFIPPDLKPLRLYLCTSVPSCPPCELFFRVLDAFVHPEPAEKLWSIRRAMSLSRLSCWTSVGTWLRLAMKFHR